MAQVTPVLIGSPAPSYPAYGRQAFWAKRFDGLMFFGPGSGSNTGPSGADNNNDIPAEVFSLNPSDNSFTSEVTLTGYQSTPALVLDLGDGDELTLSELDPFPDDQIFLHRPIGGAFAAIAAGNGVTHVYCHTYLSTTLIVGKGDGHTTALATVTPASWPHSLSWSNGTGGSQTTAGQSMFIFAGKVYVTQPVTTASLFPTTLLEWSGSGTTFAQPTNIKFAQWFPSTTPDTSVHAKVHRPTVVTLGGTEAVYYVAAKNVNDHQSLPYGNALYRATAISSSGAGSITTSQIDLDTVLSATGVRVWDLYPSEDGLTLYALVEYTTGGGEHRAAWVKTTDGPTWAEENNVVLPHADVFPRCGDILDGVHYYALGCGSGGTSDTPYSAGAQAEVGDIYSYDTNPAPLLIHHTYRIWTR